LDLVLLIRVSPTLSRPSSSTFSLPAASLMFYLLSHLLPIVTFVCLCSPVYHVPQLSTTTVLSAKVVGARLLWLGAPGPDRHEVEQG
jgi:hypothetical protein